MAITLHYGANSKLELKIAPEALVAECGVPDMAALAEPAAAIAGALDRPLDYPPLAQTVVSGDKVVLALGPHVPEAETIVRALVERLAQTGIAAADVTLLVGRPEQPAQAAEQKLLTDELGIQLHVHDPLDRNYLSYLAASTEGKPIYVNRSLAEADLAIPIVCLRPDDAPLYRGALSDIFPALSDEKTIQRYRSPIAVESPVQARRFRREVDEVGWLLGLHYLVAAVPAGPGELLGLFAGRAAAVAQAGGEFCDRLWRFSVPRRADLVVAGIPGPAAEQTWHTLALALIAAGRLVADGGAIALCSELAEPPGAGLQALRGAEQPHLALRELAQVRPSDTLATLEVARAVERGRVYLVSRLDEILAEDLGLAPITDPEQLVRLAARYPSCTVLANAQYASAGVAGEAERTKLAEGTTETQRHREDVREGSGKERVEGRRQRGEGRGKDVRG